MNIAVRYEKKLHEIRVKKKTIHNLKLLWLFTNNGFVSGKNHKPDADENLLNFQNKPIYIVFYRWINILILVRDFVGFRPFYRLSLKTVAERENAHLNSKEIFVFFFLKAMMKKKINFSG